MTEREVATYPQGCRLIRIPCVRDERGALAFAEVQRVIPFDVERVFWIYDVLRMFVVEDMHTGRATSWWYPLAGRLRWFWTMDRCVVR